LSSLINHHPLLTHQSDDIAEDTNLFSFGTYSIAMLAERGVIILLVNFYSHVIPIVANVIFQADHWV
jgi:hypothetical protein